MRKQYRLYIDGKAERIYNQKEAAQRMGVTIATVIKYAGTGHTLAGKYQIRELSPLDIKGVLGEIGEKKRLLAEYDWDKIRFRLNPKAKGWDKNAKA